MEEKYVAPAPWTLHGNGLVLLYRFPAGFVEDHGFMKDYQRKNLKAGIGAVMLMNYKTSGVGPYREILFLPGLIQPSGKTAFTISKVYVSTYDSSLSGRRNWGIPKELADFEVTNLPDGSCSWKVKREGYSFFETIVKSKGITFPFTTHLLPFSKIIQEGRYGTLLTSPEATGKAKSASLQKIASRAEDFPPIQELKPLMVLSLQEFRMKFPVALQLS